MERVIAIVLKLSGAAEVAKGLQSVGQQVGTFASGFKEKLDSLAEHSRWASVFIGGALTKLAKDIVGMAATFQSFGVMAEYMTGSAEEADRMAESIREVAKATIFNVDQIAELSKRLIGNTKDVDKSTAALTALTDAVAATGGGYSELESATRAWIQTNAKAVASSEELNRQFANANIPVLRVLSEAIVKDVNHPLREYLTIGGSASGVTKQMTKDYQKATGSLDDLNNKLAIQKQRLTEAEASTKTKTSTLMNYKEQIRLTEEKLAGANNTINSYTEAQKSAGKATKSATLSVEDVMAQLQNLGELKIPGALMAESVTKALNDAYGGANQKLLNTFVGQLSRVGDVAKLTALSFLGLDEHFRPIGGTIGILTGLMKALGDFMEQNEEKLTALGRAASNSLPVLAAIAGLFVGVFYGALTGILGPIVSVATAFMGMGAVLAALFTHFVDISPIMEALTGTVDDQKDSLEEMTQKMSIMPDQMQKIRDMEEEARKKTEALNTSIDILKESFGHLGSAATELARALGLIKGSGDQAKLSFDKFLLLVSGATLVFQLEVMWLTKMAYAGRETIQVFLALLDVLTLNFDKAAEHLKKVGDLQNESALAMQNLKTEFVNQLTEINDAWNNNAQTTQDAANWCNSSIQSCLTTAQNTIPPMQSLVTDRFNQMASDIKLNTTLMDNSVAGSSASMKEQMTNSVETMSSTVTSEEVGYPKMASQVEESMSSMVKTTETEMPKIQTGTTDPLQKIAEAFDNVIGKVGDYINKIRELTTLKIGPISGTFFQHGGLVGGAYNSPVPAIVHAGERVVPRTGADITHNMAGGQTISVNLYGNVQMDSPERINELANAIGRVLGRQNELARYGAGF